MILFKMFGRQWLLTTLLVMLGAGACVRLGIWQLDRLAQRRAFNAQVVSMRAMPELDLNVTQDNLTAMEWRAVTVAGEYDFDNQIALRNQYFREQYGFHLITPLLLSDGRAVLVDRGWIPADGNSAPADWRRYDKAGAVTVKGQIRLGQTKPAFGGVADPTLGPEQIRLDLWNNLDVARIASQIPYPILPVYVQASADVSDVEPPIPYQPEVELTEGPHFGYALQWFTFATILVLGYPFYLRKQGAESK